MKNLFWILIIAFGILSCNNSNYTIISGIVINNEKPLKELTIKNNEGFSQVIKIKKDNTFLDTLKGVKSGYIIVENIYMYLIKGDHLTVQIDLKNQDKPISFLRGNSVVSNNYLLKKNYVVVSGITFKNLKDSYSMEADAFLSGLAKLKGKMLDTLSSTPDLSKEFVNFEKRSIKYDCLLIMQIYHWDRYINDKRDYKAPESITKPIEDAVKTINIKDCKEIPSYFMLLINSFFSKYSSNENKQDAVIQKIKNTRIQSLQKEFAMQLVESKLNLSNKKIDKVVSHIRSLTTDKDILKQVDEFLTKSKNLAQGQPSTAFSCEDINGKTVSLSDLKGKLVYIDVWATWCGPCRGEIPYLKKLEKEYHGKKVHFVSMSVDSKERTKDPVATWRKMVKDKKLGGIQLFNKDNWQSEFVKSYEIKSIPRFILLDKKGNIISAIAPRPSSEEIRPLLDKWLKK